MKIIVRLALLSLMLVPVISAQTLNKPKKFPAPLSAEQRATIEQGITLHDAKKYDEAIAKFQVVLDANPDATFALYEASLSNYAKGDRTKAKEFALRGANYISDELPLFYGMIANILDDEGKSDAAIKIYRDAEDILSGMPDMRHLTANISYNLGVTYVKLKKYPEARTELKKAVDANFGYASPHHLLAVVFNGTKYKVPAFAAAARLISLEYNTQRTKSAVDIVTGVLAPAVKDPKTGNIRINLTLDSPKDEGDYAVFDLILGTMMSVRGDEDKGKSDGQMFVDGVDSVIGMLAEDKKLSSTFMGKTYIPFLAEMKKLGHTQAFGYAVLYLKDNGNPEAAKWVKDNSPKLSAFLNWAKAYKRS